MFAERKKNSRQLKSTINGAVGLKKKMQIGKKIKMHEKRNLQQKDHKPLLPYEQRLSCTVQRTYLARVLFNTNKNERAG